jgi:formiminoglutamate deiminase
LRGVQARFSDDDADAWASRVEDLVQSGAPAAAAVHSVRAVPPPAVRVVAEWASKSAAVLHFHCSEQARENEEVVAAYGSTPVQVLGEAGALGPRSVAVHATHVGERDAGRLGRSGTGVCICPTTERDLADGIGPAGLLAESGCALSLGTDSHAFVDPFEEMRALELDERLASGTRGHFSPPDLLGGGTAGGHSALGLAGQGRISAGAPADLVTVSLDGPHFAGVSEASLLAHVVFAARPTDVTHVIVGGRPVVQDGHHVVVEDVAGELRRAIGAVVNR